MKALATIKSAALCLASVLAIGAGSPVHAQAPDAAPAREGKKMMNQKAMMERYQEMAEQRRKMMEAMRTSDAELTALVSKMNSAPAIGQSMA